MRRGSLPAEAEQTIAKRKTSLNKAMRDFKKESLNGQKGNKIPLYQI